MNAISPYAPNNLQRWDLDANIKSYNELQLTRIAASSQQSKEITLFTEEGDKVTISSAEQREMAYATYEAMFYQRLFNTNDNVAIVGDQLIKFHGESIEFKTSRSLNISVEGDLNEQELKDIKKALRIIDKIMRHILHKGDISEGIDKILMIGSLDSISSIEANYRYERAILIERDTIEEVNTYSAYELPEDTADTKADEPSLADLTEKIKQTVVNSGVKPTKFIKPIQRLFADIIKGLPENRPKNKPKIRLAKLIEKALIQELAQLKAPTAIPEN